MHWFTPSLDFKYAAAIHDSDDAPIMLRNMLASTRISVLIEIVWFPNGTLGLFLLPRKW